MQGSDGGEDLEFRRYVDVLLRRKLVIVATIVIFVLAGFAFLVLSTPVYDSTAQILLRPQTSSSDTGAAKAASGSGSGGSGATPEVASAVAIMESASVSDEAKKALHLTDLTVTIAPVANSNVVGITASASTAKEAVRIAQTYADTYVSSHRAQVAADTKSTTDALAAQIGTLEGQIAPIDQSLSDLNARIEATTVATSRAPLAAQRDQLAQQRQTLDTRRSDLQQRLDRLQLDTTAAKDGGVEIVSVAKPPSAPSSPQKARDLALALALGVMAGVGAAFVRDHLDDRIKSGGDLHDCADAPVLGSLPAVSGWHRSDDPLVVTQQAPQSPAGEAYARLATVLEIKGAVAKLQVVQIASASPGDGKTTTAANLGVAFARGGKQVVVVDASLRRPRLHRFFGVGNDRGLTSVLSGAVTLADALVEVPDEPRLRVLPSGPIPPNPAELLAGQSARELITRLRFEGHLVIFDGPSLPASEAIVLADRVDAVLLVAYLNRTTRSDLAEATALFEHIETPVVGTILNGTKTKSRNRFAFWRRKTKASPALSPFAESHENVNGRVPSDTETHVAADR